MKRGTIFSRFATSFLHLWQKTYLHSCHKSVFIWFLGTFVFFIGFPAFGTLNGLNLIQWAFLFFCHSFATIHGLFMEDNNAIPYKLARLVDRNGDLSKRWYVEFYAWDEDLQKLRRKQMFIPAELKTKKERKNYAEPQIKEINRLLVEGKHFRSKPVKQKLPPPPVERFNFKKGVAFAVNIKLNIGKDRTTERYSSVLNIFNLWIDTTPYADIDLRDVQKKHIYSFLDWLKQVRRVGNRTRNNYLNAIKAIFNTMVERDYIQKNPCMGIVKLKEAIGRNIAFTENEAELLRNYLLKNDLRLYYFSQFIYHAFIRPKELLNLKIKDIDFKSRTILIPGHLSKNGKQQAVTITKPLARIIEEMKILNDNPNFQIFSKDFLPGTKIIHRNRASERHKDALITTKLYNKELTLYSWKHTGVVKAYRAGIDIKAIQNQLRHYSLEETDIYLKSLGLIYNEHLQEKEW